MAVSMRLEQHPHDHSLLQLSALRTAKAVNHSECVFRHTVSELHQMFPSPIKSHTALCLFKVPSPMGSFASLANKAQHLEVVGAGSVILRGVSALVLAELLQQHAVAVCSLSHDHKIDPNIELLGSRQLAVSEWSNGSLSSDGHFRKYIYSCRSVATCPEEARHLAASHTVRWVEHHSKGKVLDKYTRALAQSGRLFDEPMSSVLGLTGAGEVVGVSDTGIDHDHCFFYDPKVNVPFGWLNPEHRKLVRYDGMDDSPESHEDVDEGHGTHVVGILAGDPLTRDEDHHESDHGIVRDAKIVFYDLAKRGDTADAISLPSRISEHIFPIAYSAGARIHTNSWGGAKADYTSYSEEVDQFMVSNTDFLILFAAGNEADQACEKSPQNTLCDKYTVLSPSTNKNGLSVGSSMAPYPSWLDMGEANYKIIVTDPVLGSRRYKVVKGQMGPKFPTLNSSFTLRLGSPMDACAALQVVPPGTVIIVTRGTCFFSDKLFRIQEAGAIGGIVINNVPGDPIIMGIEGSAQVKIPSFMISQMQGEKLQKLIESSGVPVMARISQDNAQDPDKSEDNLSDFSSRGPTRDLRFKPDLVTVGEFVFSARSDATPQSYNCDIFESMGTSMAAPTVAGAAVIIRQFYRKGLYRKTPIPSPSAALLKATLLQSAVPLRGMVDRNSQGDWMVLPPTPNFYEGHGVLQMNSSIPVGENSKVQMFVYDSNEKKLQTGEVHRFCIWFRQSAEQRHFRATLVWTDHPSTPFSKWNLINNLDLVITTPEGDSVYGNIGATPDVLNTAEKVTIPVASTGFYSVAVVASSVSWGSQSYALVASGDEDAGSCGASCPASCSGHGQCHDGFCVCGVGYHGAACNRAIRELYAGDDPVVSTVEVTHMDIYRFQLPEPSDRPHIEFFTVNLRRLDKNNSDPDIFIRRDALPVMTASDGSDYYSEATCDSCGDGAINREVQHTMTVRGSGQPWGVFYIGVFGSCCVASTYKIWIEISEKGRENVPTVSSVTPEVASGTSLLTIIGTFLNPLPTLPVVRVVLVGNTTAQYDCQYDPKHSSATAIVCMLGDMMTAESGLYTVRVIVSGTIVLVPHKVYVVAALSDTATFTVIGLRNRACIIGEKCVPTHQELTFPYVIALQGGGDVFLVGRGIGDMAAKDLNPSLVTIGGLPCALVEGLSTTGDQIHCKTAPRSTGLINARARVNVSGNMVPSSIATITFINVAPELRLVTRVDGKFPSGTSIVHITYQEIINGDPVGVRIQGSGFICQECNGYSEDIPTEPKMWIKGCSHNITVLSDTVAECSLDPISSAPFHMNTITPLEVTVWGYTIPVSATFGLLLSGKPTLLGISKGPRDERKTSVELLALDEVTFCLIGDNFDLEVGVTMKVMNDTKNSKEYSPYFTTFDMACFRFHPSDAPLNNVVSFVLNCGMYKFGNDTITLTFRQPPYITGVSLLPGGNPLTRLTFMSHSAESRRLYLHTMHLPVITRRDRWRIQIRIGEDCNCVLASRGDTPLMCKISPYCYGENQSLAFAFDGDRLKGIVVVSFPRDPPATLSEAQSFPLTVFPSFFASQTSTVITMPSLSPTASNNSGTALAIVMGASCGSVSLLPGMFLLRNSINTFTLTPPDIPEESIRITLCVSFGMVTVEADVQGPFSESEEILLRFWAAVPPIARPVTSIQEITLMDGISPAVEARLDIPLQHQPISMGERFMVQVVGVNLYQRSSELELSCDIANMTFHASTFNSSLITYSLVIPLRFTACGSSGGIVAVSLRLGDERVGVATWDLGSLRVISCALRGSVEVCSGHGTCQENGRCLCLSPLYFGDTCAHHCPTKEETIECSGHGTCDKTSAQCHCSKNHFTADCSKVAHHIKSSDTVVWSVTPIDDSWDLVEVLAEVDLGGYLSVWSTEPRGCPVDVYFWTNSESVGKSHLAAWKVVDATNSSGGFVSYLPPGSFSMSAAGYFGLYPTCRAPVVRGALRYGPTGAVHLSEKERATSNSLGDAALYSLGGGMGGLLLLIGLFTVWCIRRFRGATPYAHVETVIMENVGPYI